jgi:hypothetical protein
MRIMQRFNHFIMIDLNEDSLSSAYVPGNTYRPILSGDYNRLALSRRRLSRTRRTDPDREYNDYIRLYAERAAPYLTLNEFVQATTPVPPGEREYPPARDILPAITAAETEHSTSTPPTA